MIRAVKAEAGSDFPVWCRIDAVEYRTPGGITIDDAMRTAELAEEAGADAIHVSAYADGSSAPGFLEAPLVHREAGFVEFAAAIKRRVGIPVIAVGRIEPELANRLIREGQIDLVSMARKLLADPELARKLEEGRPEDIRPCIYCYTCVAQAFFDRPVRCAVNPLTAREAERGPLSPVAEEARRHVVVVGGGPAGLEAARVAALRGHRVTLCEREDRIGGALRFAALAYAPNERLLAWLEGQVTKLGVDVRRGFDATPERLRSLEPDVVVVAVGARRERPVIAGIDRPHVFDGDQLRDLLGGSGGAMAGLPLRARVAITLGRRLGLTSEPGRLRRWSKRYMPLGRRVAIVGGGLVGCELAEFLAERGREVTVFEEGEVFGAGFAHPRRWRVLYELRKQGVRLESGARVVEIGDGEVRFERKAESGGLVSETLAADHVLIAAGLVENRALAKALEREGFRVVEIGDGTGVGYIEGAIHGGYEAAEAL